MSSNRNITEMTKGQNGRMSKPHLADDPIQMEVQKTKMTCLKITRQRVVPGLKAQSFLLYPRYILHHWKGWSLQQWW